MAAAKRNNYAQKWDEKTVVALLSKIEQEIAKDDCLYLGSALVTVNQYNDVWRYWKHLFKDNEQVYSRMKLVEQVLETRLYTKALNDEVNRTVAMFGLKHNHDWNDKQELEHTGGLSINWNEEKTYDEEI